MRLSLAVNAIKRQKRRKTGRKWPKNGRKMAEKKVEKSLDEALSYKKSTPRISHENGRKWFLLRKKN